MQYTSTKEPFCNVRTDDIKLNILKIPLRTKKSVINKLKLLTYHRPGVDYIQLFRFRIGLQYTL